MFDKTMFFNEIAIFDDLQKMQIVKICRSRQHCTKSNFEFAAKINFLLISTESYFNPAASIEQVAIAFLQVPVRNLKVKKLTLKLLLSFLPLVFAIFVL